MTHITCRLTAKIRDQLRNPTLAEYGLPFAFSLFSVDIYLGVVDAAGEGSVDGLHLIVREQTLWTQFRRSSDQLQTHRQTDRLTD